MYNMLKLYNWLCAVLMYPNSGPLIFPLRSFAVCPGPGVGNK
jgi:hypothetical protein